MIFIVDFTGDQVDLTIWSTLDASRDLYQITRLYDYDY
jgi:hypothetical protein